MDSDSGDGDSWPTPQTPEPKPNLGLRILRAAGVGVVVLIAIGAVSSIFGGDEDEEPSTTPAPTVAEPVDEPEPEPAEEPSEEADPVVTVLATETDCARLQEMFDGWLDVAEAEAGTDVAEQRLDWADAADARMAEVGCYDEPEPEPESFNEADYVEITDRDFAKIVRVVDDHVGEKLVIYGEVFQFDVITGPDVMLADVGAERQVPDSGFVFYDTTAALAGSAELFDDLIEDDLFKAHVTVTGSITYETAMTAQRTVPSFSVEQIAVEDQGGGG